jgi:mono/diheme cytochrome c family protein
MCGLAASCMTTHRLTALVGGVLLAAIGAAAFGIYGGLYNVAADVPHTQPVFWLMTTVRERSIDVRAANVVVPSDLADPKRLALGAGQYAEMCSTCHLAPGMKRTEISRGLYPRAPELRRGSSLTPGEEFWVVKHGLKMSGMPAWGVTHNDELLWDVVAFLRKLPELTPDQYQALVKSAPRTHEQMMQEMESGEMDHEGH